MDNLNKFFISCIALVALTMGTKAYAGDNHVHVEQVGNDGDDLSLTASQSGYDNLIKFSIGGADNTFNFLQIGDDNSISWVSYWGSGKNWGGDVDGHDNNETVVQKNGATYGRHIWGDYNTVDIYQDGTHTHNLDIHANNVTHDLYQEGTGSHYSHTYFYGTTSGSVTDITQTGNANHNAQIRIQGSEETTLTLIQQGGTNQSYNLTQNCHTTGGCTVNVTQGN